MGAQESHLGSASGLNVTALKAYHVLRVAESSPAAEAGIEPFFDYIVGIGGQQVTEDGEKLANWLDEAEGKPIILQVYNSKKQEVRSVRTLPNRKWSSNDHVASNDQQLQPSLLGLSLRLCSPQNALANVWHVLDIIEGSPAQDAGLVPFGDWIIGYAGGILRGENELYEVVEEHEGRPLRLFVYNADYEVTREVVIVPNRSWGSGEGLLGCSIGFGLLHRIPKTSTHTTAPSFLLPPGGANSPENLDLDDDEDLKLLKQMEFNQVQENATISQDTLLNHKLRSHSLESTIKEEEES
ncbi:hypothetical protein PTTG_01442 [Puccinia triticina 1-1 BBBD Race 1]|uniref:PDZ GRASP-type domain-containing protein n=2 Tax=Puccinia triticina TaxID=208348 RepID=A0A0C4DEZ3_PUCT1|nr:uncharacterized protein PtA15_9A302 [Puccinia triticina]OAV99944.1 hypothetical protein PTTG_01442 [Puccinia triticina 1-1 BBBD Race 1]WAQ88177.1 hypothetical protein PtA15_9A302 [Puccinia triticina]WAR60365.1 hypothetical protein PtB15_9B304 [Puccinia triticina]